MLSHSAIEETELADQEKQQQKSKQELKSHKHQLQH